MKTFWPYEPKQLLLLPHRSGMIPGGPRGASRQWFRVIIWIRPRAVTASMLGPEAAWGLAGKRTVETAGRTLRLGAPTEDDNVHIRL